MEEEDSQTILCQSQAALHYWPHLSCRQVGAGHYPLPQTWRHSTIPPHSAKPYIPKDNLKGVVISGPTTRVPPRSKLFKAKSNSASNPRHPVPKATRVPNRWAVPPPNTITSPNSNPLWYGVYDSCTFPHPPGCKCSGNTISQDTHHPAVPGYTSLNFLGEPLVRRP